MSLSPDSLKRIAAEAAYELVKPLIRDGWSIGVGTGSTVNCFIDYLAQSQVKNLSTVSSSRATTKLLLERGIKVIETRSVDYIDVYVDGADEIDPSCALIKGGGGALTEEKIVASTAYHFICIADESKVVDRLGVFPLPVEVVPSAISVVSKSLEDLGGVPQIREFVTDNGNAIIDVKGLVIDDPDEMERTINDMAGVVCVGIFALHRPQTVLVAHQDWLETRTQEP